MLWSVMCVQHGSSAKRVDAVHIGQRKLIDFHTAEEMLEKHVL